MGADTAKLLASLDLQDQMSPKLKTAIGGVANAENRISSLGTRLSGFATNLKNNVGGALTHFSGRVKQIGLGLAAAFGVGGLLSLGNVIKKTEDFGLALERVQLLTGETAKDSGALILLFEKFGLSEEQVGQFAGFAEKTLGKLNSTTGKVAAATKSAALANLEEIKLQRQAAGLSTTRISKLISEQKARDKLNAANTAGAVGESKLAALDAKYGLHLIDAKGKVVNYSEELRQLADFYDTNASASTKAFVASTLLGRGYSELAPILAQGSAAIRTAADEADALGLGSADAATRLKDFRNTMRDLGQQVDVLQLSIGMALIPTLDDVAKSLTAFVTSHRGEIVNFIKGAAEAAKSAAGTIGNIVGQISSAWNAIPAPLRDLLLTGIVADRTVKFLFGFSPAGLVLKLGGDIVGGIAKAVGRSVAGSLISSKLLVQHVWVDNMGLGFGPQGPAAPVEAAAGMGVLAATAALAITAAVEVAIAEGVRRIINPNSSGAFIQPRESNAYQAEYRGIFASIEKADAGRREDLAAIKDSDRGLAAIYAGRREDLAAIKDSDRGLVTALDRTASIFSNAPWLRKLEASWQRAGASMSSRISGALASLLAGKNIGGAAGFLGSHLGNAGFGAGGVAQAEKVLAVLRDIYAVNKNPAVARAIGEIAARLPRLKTNRDDIAAALKEAASSDPKNQKLTVLNRLMADLKAHGDPTARKKLQGIIDGVQKVSGKQSTTNAHLATIAAKKTTFTTNLTIPIRVTRSTLLRISTSNSGGPFGDSKYGVN